MLAFILFYKILNCFIVTELFYFLFKFFLFKILAFPTRLLYSWDSLDKNTEVVGMQTSTATMENSVEIP